MAKAQSAYQYEAPRCPDNWTEPERRFYARVIEIFDDIYIKYGKVDKTTVKAIEKTLGSTSTETLNGSELSAGVANIVKLVCEKAVIDVLSTQTIAAYSFEATFAQLVTLSAKLFDFDFGTVQHMISNALVVETAVGTNVRIKNLVVDYAQMTVATIENLCIKAADGKYYILHVGEDGSVSATETTVEEVEIAAGVTKNNNLILETDIVATNLTTSNLYASVLLASEITAYRIDVDALTARTAFIQSLTSQEAFVKWLTTEKIVNDKSIEMLVGEVDAARDEVDAVRESASQAVDAANGAVSQEEFRRVIRVDLNGLHVGDSKTPCEVLIDSSSVSVVLGGQKFSVFAANYVEFGNYQLRKTADGGLTFKLR